MNNCVNDRVNAGATPATPGVHPAFSVFGLELEYMLVDAATLDIVPAADRMLAFLTPDVTTGLDWSNELVAHVIELKNPAPGPYAGLPQRLQTEIRRANARLAAAGLRLLPSGMHPWMDPARETVLWPHAGAPIYAAYDRIFGCRAHGWANVQSTHVNLPFADDDEFDRLFAAVRCVLPLIPAIAASSPYADARATVHLDQRMAEYRGNSARIPSVTGAVIPDAVRSRSDYEREILARLYRDIAPHDPDGVLRHEWLDARGAVARFGRQAIELRVMDVQECPQADVALAAFVTDVVTALYEEHWTDGAHQRALPTSRLADVLAATIRDAEDAVIADAEYLTLFGVQRERMDAGALTWHLADRLLARGARHATLWALPLEHVLTRGTLARRLRRAAGPQPDRTALRTVYGALAEALAAGHLFDP